jgi:adenosylmethionine-8-amino-7-oxononanoate aminotransferase
MSHIWHPYTPFSALDDLLTIVRGDGIYLEDADGKRYVDAVSSWWCCALGHNNPAIVEAIRSQSGRLQHSILGGQTHAGAGELAEKLASLMPDSNRHVLFAADGASAIEAALKVSLQYWSIHGETERTQFVALQNAYHGDTLSTLALGYIDRFHHHFESMLSPAHKIPVPPYDGSEDDCLAVAEKTFVDHGRQMAALILEPLCQGAAGMRIYSESFLMRLHALCREHGVLFIADEIAMGFGRTGKMFAFEHARIDPDIVCLGKALSAGSLPISATVVRDSIYEAFSDRPEDNTFYHGHTFAGNPLACAASLAALRVYENEDIAARASRLGVALEAGLWALADLPTVSNVRCLGLIGAVELSEGLAGQVQRNMRSAGYLVRPLGNVVYLMPPLIISEENLRAAVDALCKAVREAD